ncbi:DNA-processing protein DprA [Mumia sp. zg.B53]|uniref:DNA-processing protein DprA n=1 Tax=unclassified Mumia TaxID=2621872 RepID=UPI001C6DE7A9|nr:MULTISPECIES: DNA-processing protein DprA [unclassified Mumia]MBW9205526.1 DNA-processing protein DprA [Mumia sp. zg.B17]MBW9208473.1 DNA-processing protein DprA [Mumia sp. zg.B21]MBW9216430.1 DNA-processing protein DprA [Mumia sp. zg.B53]MDD9347743.1 DNA-processing protein DprA [Mumia sp.]
MTATEQDGVSPRGRRDERRARLGLSLVAEPGDPRLAAGLLERTPTELLAAVTSADAGTPEAWRARAVALDTRLEATVTVARGAGLRWVCPGDAGWPERLDDLDQVGAVSGVVGRPLGLWVRGRGRLDDLTARSAAVVGARDATTYGRDVAGDLAADLVDAGTAVVSGAAFGIDAAAHRGALALGGPTVAVLACGLDIDYPRAHASLLRAISESGLLVSEHPPGATPTRSRFLTRNRIIAGLTQGTVVVEAARRSGALNTLSWANELGRLTMAVPGPVAHQSSVGVHQAIREGRAVLVTNGAEVLEDLDVLGRRDATPPSAPATVWDGLDPTSRAVIEALPAQGPRTTDEIAWHAGASPEAVAAALDHLERSGFVRPSGRGWHLARRADLARAGDGAGERAGDPAAGDQDR